MAPRLLPWRWRHIATMARGAGAAPAVARQLDWACCSSDSGPLRPDARAVGSATAPDSEIFAFARDHDYVVLTHDLDFSMILATTHGEKPSVVQIRSSNVNVDTMGTHVISALMQMMPDLEQGALITIDSRRVRVRTLPLLHPTP